ncbi:MFS transporter [Streptomyces sp. NPDC093089]|uniref:MFS transporter n=1 Tax=Streptomyces sp. NPDC093089 TaxID=3366024 RepID=UPI003826C6E1
MKLPSVADYVPATPAGRTFALTALISSVGTGLFLAGSTVFFIRYVGLSNAQIGLGLAVAACFGFLATVPVGVIGDRFGPHRTLIGAQLWRAGCFVGLVFVDGPLAFVVVASCMAAAEGSTPPLTQAVVAETTGPEDRVRTMAIIRTVRNVGFSLGALLAAPLLSASSTTAYQSIVLGNALAFALSAGLLLRLRLPKSTVARTSRSALRAIRGFRDWRYVTLAGLNGTLSLHMTILSVGIPLWTVQATEAPAAIVPILVFTNTVLAVLLQVPFSNGADDSPGAGRALRRGGLALAGCCVAFALAQGTSAVVAVGVLAVGCVLLTFGELWQAVGGWQLSYLYAPEKQKATYLSVFNLGSTGQGIIGPSIVTTVVIGTGRIGWIGLAVFFVLAALLVRPVITLLDRAPRPAPADEPASEPLSP